MSASMRHQTLLAHLPRDELPRLGDDDHLARIDIADPSESDRPKGAVLRGNAPVVPLGTRATS